MTAGEREAFHDMRRIDFEREQMERADSGASAIREYLEAKAALPENEWLRREPRGTHPAILEAVRDCVDGGGFYDDDVERYVNERAGDLPPHERHGGDRHRLLKQLGHEVYIARGILHDEERQAKADTLLAEGFAPLAGFEVAEGGRYMLVVGTLYVGAKVAAYGDPRPVRAHAMDDGRTAFLLKGARTRGYLVSGPAMIREGWTS